MWGIPDWAFGAAFSAIGLFVGLGLMIRILPRELQRPGRKGATREELDVLENVERKLGEIDDLQRRLTELEERLDFAERLLANQRDTARRIAPER
jgi:hypothetical protein